MAKQLLIFSLAVFLFGTHCTSVGVQESEPEPEQVPDSAEPLESAEVRFEQNATDGDFEVVFEAMAGDEGIVMLKVVSPDGRTVVDFHGPDANAMGIRQFLMESPEPADEESLKKAYPEGVYTITAKTSDGKWYRSEASLSLQLPATVSVLNPAPESEDVAIEGLELKWSPVENVAFYLIEIESEDEDLPATVNAKLPATSTSFAVPPNFLQPGVEYKIAVGTQTGDGNLSVVETTFVTAGEDDE